MGRIKPFRDERMLSVLQGANSILLCTHRSPDGDAVGSMLAMGLALQQMGKRVTMACHDPVPEKIRFLQGAGEIIQADALGGAAFDVGLALDAADRERLGDCANAYSQCLVTMQIDHHDGNLRYAEYNEVDADAGATGVMVYRALEGLGVGVTAEMAQCLYCAISLDTGNFCYSSATGETFSVMAELMDAGLPLTETARRLHLLREEPNARLLGRALDSLHVFGQGRCAGMQLTAADFAACHALPEHASKIVNYGLDLPGVKMAFLVEESDGGTTKGSLRALAPYDVAAIARQFGGGGHILAAGFRAQEPLDDVCEKLKEAMLQALEAEK